MAAAGEGGTHSDGGGLSGGCAGVKPLAGARQARNQSGSALTTAATDAGDAGLLPCQEGGEAPGDECEEHGGKGQAAKVCGGGGVSLRGMGRGGRSTHR